MVTAVGAASHSSLVLGSADRVAATLRRSGATMPDEELHIVAELMLRRRLDLHAQPARAASTSPTSRPCARTPSATWLRWCPELGPEPGRIRA